MRFPQSAVFSLTVAILAGVLSGCSDGSSHHSGTPTPTPEGPTITFLGLTAADDELISPSRMTEEGVPVYVRPFGSGFSLVVEAKAGPSGAAVGDSSYDESLDGLPDLQIEASRALGNGSHTVCDDPQTMPGGVPAIAPVDFDPNRSNIDTINDLACRFVDGSGAPIARTNSADSCVAFSTGDYAFVDPASEAQFCGFMSAPLAFPSGETTITVRVRDVDGNVGPERQIILAVESPTPTPPASGPVITFLGLARADDALIEPDSVSVQGIPIFTRATRSGFSLVVEGKRGASGEAIGLNAYDPDGTAFPDLQIQVSQPLGDGSTLVCDDPETMPGGVPATPAGFEDTADIVAAVNDLSCRFLDGSGTPTGRTSSGDSCVVFPSGEYAFVHPETEAQFCGFMNVALSFPTGNTLVTVRLRDVDGNVGPQEQILIRVTQ